MKIKNRRMPNDQRQKAFRGFCLTIFLFVGLFFLQIISLKAQRIDQPFSSGESALYGAYYNWHFLWVNAGEVSFSNDTVQYENQLAWNFKAIGKTYKGYDLFYTVRDTFESYVSHQNFHPLWFRRAVNHGSSYSLHEYNFSMENGQIESKIKRDKEEAFIDQVTYVPGVLDLLSSAYHFRGFNYDNMDLGQKVNFTMLVDNKVEELYFRYQGIEKIRTREGRKFQCHQLSVWLMEGDFFPEGEHMRIWLTADKNHLPIMVETKIRVGSVKAIFLGAENLKYPLTSEIY